TQHLSRSRLLMYLFDPTQDPRFRRLFPESNLPEPSRTGRQESVLHEAAMRVRRQLGLSHDERHSRPLIVGVTKADEWGQLLESGELNDPWLQKEGIAGLNTEAVEAMSCRLRSLLLKIGPEIVTAAENFAESVIYVPVSALGSRPQPHPATGK